MRSTSLRPVLALAVLLLFSLTARADEICESLFGHDPLQQLYAESSPRVQRKVDRVLARVARRYEAKRPLGRAELAAAVDKASLPLLRRLHSPEDLRQALAAKAAAARDLQGLFEKHGLLNDSRLRNKLAAVLSLPAVARTNDLVFGLWPFPDLETAKVSDSDSSLKAKAFFSRVKPAYRVTLISAVLVISTLNFIGEFTEVIAEQGEDAVSWSQRLESRLDGELSSHKSASAEAVEEFKAEFRKTHGREPTDDDPEFQLILRIYGRP